MKTEQVNSMGFEFPVNGLPETVEEFDKMAGRVGACLDGANAHYIAHTHLTKVRTAIVEAVEKVTGIEREKTVEGDKTTYAKTEARYIASVQSALEEEGKSLEDPEYLTYITDAASAVEVDLTKQTRSGGGTARVAQKWLDVANDRVIVAGKADAFAEVHGINIDGKEGEELAKVIGAKLKELAAAALRKVQEDALAL
jgi:hypothetical protein